MVDDNSEFVLQLSHQLIACGAPIERLLLTIQTLNPEIAATSQYLDEIFRFHRAVQCATPHS